MRWRAFFDDLEAQLAAGIDAETDAERIERQRHADDGAGLLDRLEAASRGGSGLELRLIDGSRMVIGSVECGLDWVAGVATDATASLSGRLVPLGAIATARPISSAAEPLSLSAPDTPMAAAVTTADVADVTVAAVAPRVRMPLTVALRDLARRRLPVELGLLGHRLHGTIDRVGRDHLELARHGSGTVRRADAVSGTELVPLAQLLCVRFRW